MQISVLLLSVCLLITNTDGGILIPEEIATLLSLVYSAVPPIKVGKDSRFGLGFRVGPNIDYQVVLELGPQTNTQPLGQTGSKRDVITQKTKELKPKSTTAKQPTIGTMEANVNITNYQATENTKPAVL